MPLYENDRNAENRIKVKKEWSDAVVFGTGETLSEIDLPPKNGSTLKVRMEPLLY